VHTPAFEPVATKGTLKGLTPQHIVQLGAQLSFVNTYHLVTHPGVEIIKNAGGIHEYSGMRRTLMSDSGGFQVFSLARESRKANIRGEEDPMLVKISDSGVQFRSIYDGALIEFSPELSMQYQIDIGADIHMAFDECTYYGATHEYSETSLGRTHDWLQRCLMYRKTHMHQQNTQFLYGVIQGGCYEDLRVKSAKFIHSLPVDGVAVGGVSVGESKKEMRDQVGWVAPYLPDDRPVHLLGVGHIDDILDMVACGIDTFDCVEPSRLARMGILLHISDHADIRDIKWTEIDVTKQKYKNDYTALSHLDTLLGHVPTYSYIYHLFKQKELLAYTIATMHNIYVMERLMERIRTAIEQNII
jgi:tRNA-guanine transglycosylase